MDLIAALCVFALLMHPSAEAKPHVQPHMATEGHAIKTLAQTNGATYLTEKLDHDIENLMSHLHLEEDDEMTAISIAFNLGLQTFSWMVEDAEDATLLMRSWDAFKGKRGEAVEVLGEMCEMVAKKVDATLHPLKRAVEMIKGFIFAGLQLVAKHYIIIHAVIPAFVSGFFKGSFDLKVGKTMDTKLEQKLSAAGVDVSIYGGLEGMIKDFLKKETEPSDSMTAAQYYCLNGCFMDPDTPDMDIDAVTLLMKPDKYRQLSCVDPSTQTSLVESSFGNERQCDENIPANCYGQCDESAEPIWHTCFCTVTGQS